MGRHRVIRALVTGAVSLAFVAAFLAQAGTAEASPPAWSHSHSGALYVAPSGQAGNPDRNCQTAAFPTIQSAIDAASPWATVVVCPGTYHEQVVVDEPLTVTGEGATVDETGVTPSLVVSPPGMGSLTIFAGVVLLSSWATFSGFHVQDALGEGILAIGATGTISHVTISSNVVTHNDLGGGVPPASAYFECQPFPEGTALVPNDCGEGIHLLSVAYSTVVGNTSSDNSGGILLTDEAGPTHGNWIVDNNVVDNLFDCGITVPGHNPKALSATGQRQPGVAGVYGNIISGNRVIGNGTQGEGAGVLFANAAPGTASYDNLVVNNYIAGNGQSGVTMHAHTLPPGTFEDLDNNRVINNVIGTNNLLGDSLDSPPPPAPATGPRDLETTGVLIFSGGTPVHTTVAGNRIYDNHYGVWTSSVVSTAGLPSNQFLYDTVPLSLDN